MTEETQNKNHPQMPAIVMNSQYVKDLSLEIPHAPQVFKRAAQERPEVKIDVEVKTEKLEDNLFNVSLNFQINGNFSNEPLFILELYYAGVAMVNVPAEHLEPVLMIEIPRLLFPFARSVITNNLVDAGLPPFMINPIDFVGLYQQRKQAANAN